jgi:hypothetical protein
MVEGNVLARVGSPKTSLQTMGGSLYPTQPQPRDRTRLLPTLQRDVLYARRGQDRSQGVIVRLEP